FEDLDHPINFNFGGMRGGDWPSSVPAWCELQVRVAIYPGMTAEDARKQVEDCVHEAANSSKFDAVLTPDGFFAEGYVLEPGSDAEALLEQTHKTVFSKDLT